MEEGPEATGVGVSWAGPSEEDPSYRLLVDCNQLAVRALHCRNPHQLLQPWQIHGLRVDCYQLAARALHSARLVPEFTKNP